MEEGPGAGWIYVTNSRFQGSYNKTEEIHNFKTVLDISQKKGLVKKNWTLIFLHSPLEFSSWVIPKDGGGGKRGVRNGGRTLKNQASL